MDFFAIAIPVTLVVTGTGFVLSFILLMRASLGRHTLTGRMRLFAYSCLVLLAPLPLAATVWVVASGVEALVEIFIVLLLWFAGSILILELQFWYYRRSRQDLERLWMEHPWMRGLLGWSWETLGMDLPGHDRDARQARAAMPVFGVLYRAIDRLRHHPK